MSERNRWPILVLTFLLNGGLYHRMSFLVCSFVGRFPPVVQKLTYNCIHSRRELSGMLVRRGRKRSGLMIGMKCVCMFLVIEGG